MVPGEMTPRERDAKVCEKLLGWKRPKCEAGGAIWADGRWRCHAHHEGTGGEVEFRNHTTDGEPPDLRTYHGMGRLIEALAAKGFPTVEFWTGGQHRHVATIKTTAGKVAGRGPTLADAAYEALFLAAVRSKKER
jgi:hypothetical protein